MRSHAAASQTAVSTSSPSRAALCSSAASIPGAMSVQVAARTTPSCMRFNEKYPFPAADQATTDQLLGVERS